MLYSVFFSQGILQKKILVIKMKNKVKIFRAIHDITQEELGKELGVTRQTIIAIEKEKYDPSLILAFKMARYFKTQIEDIFIYKD